MRGGVLVIRFALCAAATVMGVSFSSAEIVGGSFLRISGDAFVTPAPETGLNLDAISPDLSRPISAEADGTGGEAVEDPAAEGVEAGIQDILDSGEPAAAAGSDRSKWMILLIAFAGLTAATSGHRRARRAVITG